MEDAILRAPPMTHFQNLTGLTIAGQGILFGLPKGSLRSALQKIDQGSLLDIPQPVCRFDEMIARKEVSVMFHNGNIPAGRPKNAQGMLLPEGSSGHLFEYLHFDSLDIPQLPLVEEGAEEMAPGFSRNRAVADASLCIRLRLDQGQKPQVLGADLLEKPVNRNGMPDVLCIHHAEDIDRDPVLP